MVAQEPWVVGVDTASSRLQMVASNSWIYSFDCAKLGKADERRHAIYEQAQIAFAQIPADSLVLIEEPLSHLNGNTNKVLAMAAAVVELAAFQAPQGFFTAWVDNNTWKKEILGTNRLDKDAIKAGARALGAPDWKVADLYDCYCLMLYGKPILAKHRVGLEA